MTTEPEPAPTEPVVVPGYAADALPGGRWGTYRPRGTVDAVRVQGGFTFTAADGAVTEVADGWIVSDDGTLRAVEAGQFADTFEAADAPGGGDIGLGRVAELERVVATSVATGPVADTLRAQLAGAVETLREDAVNLRTARDAAQAVAADTTVPRSVRDLAGVAAALATSLLKSRPQTVAMGKLLARALDSADTG